LAVGSLLHRLWAAFRSCSPEGGNLPKRKKERRKEARISTRRVWTATFSFSAIASALVGLLIGGVRRTGRKGEALSGKKRVSRAGDYTPHLRRRAVLTLSLPPCSSPRGQPRGEGRGREGEEKKRLRKRSEKKTISRRRGCPVATTRGSSL